MHQRRVEPAQALTSINGFWKTNISDISDGMAKSWSDIGLLTHGFKFWKYDAQGGPESLFARYGFKLLPESSTDKRYGKGFVMKKPGVVAPGTLVQFRRAYLLVSQQQHGTLVIRNSSPEFGRDLMPYPAYWSPQILREKDLANLMPETDSRFTQVLNLDTNLQYRMDNHLSSLLNQLVNVKEDYRRWKFDTGAFTEGEFSGHRSPGLKPLLDMLRLWALNYYGFGAESRKPPSLGFVHPDYPPWETYSYIDSNGVSQKTYELTEAHAHELGAYADSNWSREKLMKTDLYRFLDSGIRNRGELVLLSSD